MRGFAFQKLSHLLGVSLIGFALVGCGEDGPPSDDPGIFFGQLPHGYAAPVGLMMMENETPAWVQSALTGFRPVDDNDIAAKVENISMNNCSFAPPAADDIVKSVLVPHGVMPAPVYSFSQADIRERVKKSVEPAPAEAQGEGVPVLAHGQFAAVDVVVTESSKPVYLVLGYEDKVLFNIHLAEGAKLSRIALVGPGHGGVANIDPSVPITALYGSSMAMCKISPSRKPADHWGIVMEGDRDAVKTITAQAGSYSAWHKNNFGIPSEPGSIGGELTSHVLVGPLPADLDTRVAYKPLKGAKVWLTPNDYMMSVDATNYSSFTSKLLQEAGGATGSVD